MNQLFLQVALLLWASVKAEIKGHYDVIKMVHGGEKRIIKRINTPYPEFLDPAVTILSTDKLPTLSRLMPTIGNGYVATVVHSDTVYMNGLYNGYTNDSHRARIPSTCSINILNASRPIISSKYSLDLGRGMYIERHQGEFFTIELKMYAHRQINPLIVTEIVVRNSGPGLTVQLSVNTGPPSDDINLVDDTKGIFRVMRGFTKEAETNSTGTLPVYVVYSRVPEEIKVEEFEQVNHAYFTLVDTNEGDVSETIVVVLSYYFQGILEYNHVIAWTDLWKKGRIDIGGNNQLARINYASMYYLLSSIQTNDYNLPFYGLAPGGLAHGANYSDYSGHVFWDQETWMFPSILMFYADLGRTIIDTRIRTLDAARKIALKHGYKGAMYPWESAYSGYFVCPYNEEHHITGDIAMSIKQYLMMTNDTDFLRYGRGVEAIVDIATFWTSRVVYNLKKNMYEIKGVQPPDEYHVNKSNSVYTNVIAKISLLLPKYALPLVNLSPSVEYEEIGNKIFVPFNETGRWHPEYDGYTQDVIVKQADAVLLGFPLMYHMSSDVRKNDLLIYEKVTPDGPAMTWGMFAIGWLELNDSNKARELFLKQLGNIKAPFNIWTEFQDGSGAVNFITGMGGYLQSMIFGYGGFRIYPDKLRFNGQMPPDSANLNITGIDYLGGCFDFSFWNEGMSIILTEQTKTTFTLLLKESKLTYQLNIGKMYSFKRQEAYIEPNSVQ